MKVTIFSNSKGGVFSYTINLVKGLAHKGCDVNVFFLTQSEETKRLVASRHVHFNVLTTSNFVPNLRTIINLFFHDRPDIIHINFALFGPLAIFKKLVFKTPFIYTLHGLPQPWLHSSLVNKIKYTMESLLLPFVASQASAIVAVSNYVKDVLKIRYGLDSQVIYNGVNTSRFKPTNKKRSKRKLGYDETDFVVLFVGKLSPYKDPLTLIEAINKAIKINKNFHLIMVGTGDLYKEVIHAIDRLNLSSHVKPLGHVSGEELRLCYNASNLFVLPTFNEAFGIVLLEAMASGLPIIASNSGACPEVIGNAGILFNPGDCIDLAEKIMELSCNEDLLRRFSNEGLKRVQTFSWEVTTNDYWKLYTKIGCMLK